MSNPDDTLTPDTLTPAPVNQRDPKKNRHPAVVHLLQFFDSRGQIGGLFTDLAWKLAHDEASQGPELTVALRKLLEAQDAAKRAKAAL